METAFFEKIKRVFNRSPTETRFQMISENSGGFYVWDGKLYQSDIVRACIRPKVKAVGKLAGKQIRESTNVNGERTLQVNPDVYMRFLLEEPNPYMTGQVFQEKMAAQLCLNRNAFALIIRDENELPCEIYPIPAASVQPVYDKQRNLYLKFVMLNGKTAMFSYMDIIHLREDFYDDDIFGESPARALAPLMEIVGTTDQGVVRAIKNSGVIQWLLKYPTAVRPEDLKKNAESFAKNYLSISNDSMGVAATDSKAEAIRVEPKDYVPNAAQMDRTTQRIYSFFNVNEKIVQSRYTEDEWIAYFEAEIEPVAMQLSGEYTRKLFTRRQRGFGNRIYFEASSLQYASMSTKLALQAMVDRSAMTPNEWRAALNLAPLPGGDTALRRLDTQTVKEGSTGES